MNKTVLKLLSCGLAVSTFCNFPNALAKSADCPEKKGGLSTAAKVCIGIGAGAAACAVVGFTIWGVCAHKDKEIYYDDIDAAPDNNSDDKNNSFVNANLSNTKNLCYWHSFVQQMYSLKSFRAFISEVDLNSLNPKVQSNVAAFREFFNGMNVCKDIDASKCLAFAEKLLPKSVVNPITGESKSVFGQQNSMDEILSGMINDVFEAYGRFCQSKYNTKNSNILMNPLQIGNSRNLQDLLNDDSVDCNERVKVVGDLLKDPENRKAVLREYLKDICGVADNNIPSSVNVGTVKSLDVEDHYKERRGYLVQYLLDSNNARDFYNIVGTDLADMPLIKQALNKANEGKQLDVPVLDNQFVLFLNRTSGVTGADSDPNSVVLKNKNRISFGDGTVQFRGSRYQLTAVSMHKGATGNSGHYVTYKKEKDSNWYLYDDCRNNVESVSFQEVKQNAETECTMLTFSKI